MDRIRIQKSVGILSMKPSRMNCGWTNFECTKKLFTSCSNCASPKFVSTGQLILRFACTGKDTTWLAHVHTSRQLRNRFDVPHKAFTERILRPTIAVMHKVLVQEKQTQTIRWPSSLAKLQAVADGFLSKYGLLGCVGAIDGSLIPQKSLKRSPQQQPGGMLTHTTGTRAIKLASCLRLWTAITYSPMCMLVHQLAWVMQASSRALH
jgi:hypothetical protein